MPPENQKIAILGWGSLIWDAEHNREFDRLHGKWMPDGPVLNLEFSRKSKKSRAGALTLVVDLSHGTPCTVVYALSTRSNPSNAIKDLRHRERTSAENIGRFFADKSQPDRAQNDAVLGTISEWAREKGLDVVLWTDLVGDFDAVPAADFVPRAVDYIQGLTVKGKSKAAEYVWRAPDFVRTPLREALQKEPWFTPPK